MGQVARPCEAESTPSKRIQELVLHMSPASLPLGPCPSITLSTLVPGLSEPRPGADTPELPAEHQEVHPEKNQSKTLTKVKNLTPLSLTCSPDPPAATSPPSPFPHLETGGQRPAPHEMHWVRWVGLSEGLWGRCQAPAPRPQQEVPIAALEEQRRASESLDPASGSR